MLYSRAWLVSSVLAGLALPAQRAVGQASLPAILQGAAAKWAPAAHARSEIGPTAPAPEPALKTDLPRGLATFRESARSLRDSLVALARAQIGRRYRLGGASPEHGFDCSGLVRYVMAALQIALPRTAKDQARSGTTVARDTNQLRPGDLVTFGSARRISHIGIYVGDGRFVQASSKAGRVIETPLNRRLVRGVKPWRGVRRVMPPGDSTMVTPESAVPSERGDAE